MNLFHLIRRFNDVDENAFWLRERELSSMPRTVYALAWKPSGDQIASAHTDSVVRIWDTENAGTVEPIRYLVHRKYVVSVAWSPNGTRIASGDTQADPVCIWDSSTGQELIKFEEHESWPWAIAWSNDGRQMVSGGADGRIFLWDPSSGTVIRQLHRPQDAFSTTFTALAWSSTGKYLAASNLDSELLIWRTIDWALVVNLKDRVISKRGTPFCWSPYQSKLATITPDNRIDILDVDSGFKVQTSLSYEFSEQEREDFCAIAWSSDGQRIACTEGGKQVRVWNEGRLLIPISNQAAVTSLAWKPNETRLATGDISGSVCLWTPSPE